MMKKIIMFMIAVATMTVYAQETKSDEAKQAPAVENSLTGIKINGMLRLRPEVKANNNFVAGQPNNLEFVGSKLWLTVSKEFKDGSKMLVTIQDARVFGDEQNGASGLSTANETQALDVREAYVDLANFLGSPLNLQIGRQKLIYGDQRLIGGLDWTNVGRSFDAARLKWDTKTNSLHAWAAILTEDNSNDLKNWNGNNSREQYLSSLYNTYKGINNLFLDTYYINKTDQLNNYYLHTLGLRITNRTNKGKASGDFDYTLEAAYQLGDKNKNTKISAYAAALALGYKIGLGVPVRLGAEFDIASGDKDATDNKYETFANLVPTNHLYYGQADLISWQNMLAGNFNLTFFFTKAFSTKVAYWYLSRLTEKDAWYNVGGGVASALSTNTEKELAHEIDVTLKYKAREYLFFGAGYSIALRGKALKDDGRNGDFHFAYISSTVKF
ncbi:MAG: hypothetical protein D6767_05885 [Candidatus Hydrogenedentota bacterium]|nr:MAG: hypothetical protein D6767_05885 [Candidatus Hydrogenedentota bacterium]